MAKGKLDDFLTFRSGLLMFNYKLQLRIWYSIELARLKIEVLKVTKQDCVCVCVEIFAARYNQVEI